MAAGSSASSCRISVVIPCFNHGEFLPEAVASVTSIGRSDVEVIVADDGSTDTRTSEEIDKLAAQGIRIVRQENRGPGAARNAAIAASIGEYILPLDADNRLRPAYIEHGIRILDASPQVGVVYGDAHLSGTFTGHWRVGPFDPERLLDWNYIDTCAVYRRSVWEQNDGYDVTKLVQGLEDWDFWLGALEHGWQFAYVPEVLFDYRKAEESMLTRTRGSETQIAEFVARKHGPLYRGAWLSKKAAFQSLQSERESVKRTVRNLHRLLGLRLERKFHGRSVEKPGL